MFEACHDLRSPLPKETPRSSPSDFGGSSQLRFPHERLERLDSERRQLARFGTSVMPRVCSVDAVVRMINKCDRVRGRYPDISIHVDACDLGALLPGACFRAFSLRKTRPRLRSRERLTPNGSTPDHQQHRNAEYRWYPTNVHDGEYPPCGQNDSLLLPRNAHFRTEATLIHSPKNARSHAHKPINGEYVWSFWLMDRETEANTKKGQGRQRANAAQDRRCLAKPRPSDFDDIGHYAVACEV